MQDKSTTNDTCPNCGAHEFERGWLHTSGTGRHVSYFAKRRGNWFFGDARHRGHDKTLLKLRAFGFICLQGRQINFPPINLPVPTGRASAC